MRSWCIEIWTNGLHYADDIFDMYFLESKSWYFDYNHWSFLGPISNMSHLVLSRWQAVTWLYEMMIYISTNDLKTPALSLKYRHACINSLWPGDTIWRRGTRSTLAQVMACCLTAPSHYLNQFWLIISEVNWHSYQGNFARDASTVNHFSLGKLHI